MQYNKFYDYIDIFSIRNPNKYEFYDIKEVYEDFQTNNNSNQLLSFTIFVSTETKNIIREVYTIPQMLADIGGFVELIRILFYFFISSFSIKRFMAYIINRMYFKDQTDMHKFIGKRKVHNVSDSTIQSTKNQTYASSDLSPSGIGFSRNCNENYDI